MKSRLNHPIRPGMKHYAKLALFNIGFWLACLIVGIVYQLSKS